MRIKLKSFLFVCFFYNCCSSDDTDEDYYKYNKKNCLNLALKTTIVDSVKWSLIRFSVSQQQSNAVDGCSECDMVLAEMYNSSLYGIIADKLLSPLS